MRVSIVDAPPGWSFDGAPPVETVADGDRADLVLVFVRAAAGLESRLLELGRLVHPAGSLWVAWPRRAAGHTSDVTDDLIRDSVLPHGLVDVKVAAIDDDWSGLKIVWRLTER
ncbi:DUF3052 family protein [Lacisediminihabitans profunda]|uniref:DUF3052 family protein n=2 Tax=Lacisediminihabitans profunda TaxID=2594790 RepID=A0A5C8UTL2_9MICO|nr:DUF3052 family protein [Lacisediminihabitans profunda]